MAYKKINLRVLIDGGEVRGVFGVDTSAGVSQINAQAVIHLTRRPAAAVEGAPAEIWAGFDSRTDIIFKGELDGTEWEYFPGVVSLPARDLLARLRFEWGGDDREYTNQDDAAIIQNLVEAMGIPSSLTHIESSGWTLGTILPVIAPQGRAFWPLVEEIDKLAGFRTYTDRAGVIRRHQISGNIGVGAAFSYANGAGIIKIRRKRSLDGIVNKAVVTGLEYEGLTVGGPGVAEAQAANPFIPTPPQYITEATQSNLIEDDEKAEEIAIRTVRDKNRRPETFEVQVIGEARLQPLSIVSLAQSEIEVAGGKVIVDRVQQSIRAEPPAFETTFTTLGGTVDATATNIPPLAAFDVKLFREGEDTGAGVTSLIVGVADGSASDDPDGDAADLEYAWALSVDVGTVTPTTGSDVVLGFVIEGAATELTVSLTVTDAGGAEATAERVFPLTASTMLVEPLYLAADGVIKATADGEQTWSEFAVASGPTCLMPNAPAWGELWGDADGELWASIDKLATPAVSLGTPHGAVACTAVWVHEVDTTRLWAAFSDGAVYFGTFDPAGVTATWVAAGDVPEGPVREIRESVGALGDVRATAGLGYYHSSDGGASWTLTDSGDTAWRMAAGFDRNAYSFLNDASPLRFEEASDPTIEGSPTHIRGLTFGWQTQALYATDDAAQLYVSDDETFAALSLHADTLPAQGNHMIRSGNVNGVIYIAVGDGTGGNSGAVKWFPGTKAPWYIHKTDDTPVYMIGYGPAAPPFAPVAVLLIPFGASGAADNIFRYTPGISWEPIAPPQASWYWFGIVADPFNRDRWLLWGNNVSSPTGQYTISGGVLRAQNGVDSPFYRTDDGGATWQAIDLGVSDKTVANDRFLACWSESDPNLWAAVTVMDKPLGKEQACFWRNGDSSTSVSLTGTITGFGGGQIIGGITSGTVGEFIFCVQHGATSEIFYVPPGATTPALPEGTFAPQSSLPTSPDRLLTPARALATLGGALASDDVTYFLDYHEIISTPASITDAGVFLTAADDAVYVGGRGDGVLKVLNLDSIAAPPSSVVVPGTEGVTVGHIRAGRAYRQAIACRKTGTVDCFVRSNGIWSTLVGPADAVSGNLANWVEVLDMPEANA